LSRSLPPPNRTSSFPAYGSPVSGSPARGLAGHHMGCGQGEQPVLGKVGVRPLASFHPLFEGRQHALGPYRRFHPCPPGSGVSALRSPTGHYRRSFFRRCVLHAFHLPARPSLHARYRRFLTTTGALTPATTFAALRLSSSMNSALCPSRRSPCFTCTAFRPFRLHPPDSPLRRFRTLPLSAQGSRLLRGALDFAIESQARRSARPYRVRYPTDWSFTSHCFGPHLAVTPLCLVTGRRAHA
jgi:hypothetical protein